MGITRKGQGRKHRPGKDTMSPPTWIALLGLTLVGIQTGLKIREHLIDYPLRKPRDEDQEGD